MLARLSKQSIKWASDYENHLMKGSSNVDWSILQIQASLLLYNVMALR